MEAGGGEQGEARRGRPLSGTGSVPVRAWRGPSRWSLLLARAGGPFDVELTRREAQATVFSFVSGSLPGRPLPAPVARAPFGPCRVAGRREEGAPDHLSVGDSGDVARGRRDDSVLGAVVRMPTRAADGATDPGRPKGGET